MMILEVGWSSYIPYLRESVGMRRNDGNVSVFWVRIVERRVLFHSKEQAVVLMCRERPGEATDVRCLYPVLI